MKTAASGFTLMEVLVVVMIIGILAAIAVPNYMLALESAQLEACRANVEVLNTQVERYRLATGSYPHPAHGQSLVEHLVEIRYLTKAVACPLGGTYSLEGGSPICNICNGQEE